MPEDYDKSLEKELIRLRGSLKGRLTNFSKYLDSLTDELSTVEVKELQVRLNRIESSFQQFDETQTKLECISDEASLNSLLEERNDTENRFCKCIAKAEDLLSQYNRTDDQSDSSSTVTTKSNLKRKSVRMPPIQLPKYSGSYENWLEFRDTFTSLVHKNLDYDEISKFHYLRSSLEGSAAEVIKKVEFSASNYLTAWKILCERYDNSRLLTNNHVAALFNIPCIAKESSSSLKSMIDQYNKNLRALKTLGEPTDYWDTLLIYSATQKLDSMTFSKWEEFKVTLDKNKSIKFDTFITFMKQRADFLETLELSHNHFTSSTSNTHNNKPMAKSKNKTLFTTQSQNQTKPDSNTKSCPNCHENHSLKDCPKFLSLSNEARLDLLPQLKVCYNCFNSGHYANRCNKTGCKICKRRHHTLIHVATQSASPAAPAPGDNDKNSSTESTRQGGASASHSQPAAAVTLSSVHSPPKGEVLLSTALVKLYDRNNCEHVARALLDSGSTSCLITQRMSHVLDLPTTCIDKSILGINNVESRVNQLCQVTVRSLNDKFSAKIQCFILPSITDDLPSRPIDISGLNLPTDICLADPNFYSPAPIDLIIGADIFWDIIGAQHISMGQGNPILHETKLGWIVSGPTSSSFNFPIKCNFANVDVLQNQLTRFWQLDEVSPQSSDLSPEEKMCEDHFVKNTTRLDNGSFCVRIPLKENPNVLGDSSLRAKQCFLSIERKLKGIFGEMYRDFMAEYSNLNHMSECDECSERHAYFIPHHGVLRENSTTTKLRVVFNASSLTTSGVSLNNIQLVGPTVQDDLLSILMRFRFHKYVLAADVEKMYRTIMVHPDDRHLQQIYWRSSPLETIKIFQLNTVTYGTASAPFLATRCLKQLGIDCNDKNISDIIIHDFYVDDLLTGADSLDEAKLIRQSVTSVLAAANMNLRKWKSNEPLLVTESSPSVDLNIGGNEPSKVLGLGWQVNSDELCFPIGTNVSNRNTKRDMLSVISQIFDPLGLLSPCVIRMKMLLQRLWLLKLSWDEQLPTEITQDWAKVIHSLPSLVHLRIPRIVVCDAYNSLELHIFADASERAYGACAYVRTFNGNGEVLVRLLMAKTRVAPLKPTTIPRLELCGALLGTRLYEKVKTSLRMPIRSATFWSDSMIVLGWLKMLPNRLQPFVRNRVAEILEHTGDCQWRHIPTEHNPADFVSRGVDVDSIQSLDLYWVGPSFLSQDESTWPTTPTKDNEAVLPELRREVSLHTQDTKSANQSSFIDFNRFSDFLRLNRAVAYMLRFITACKKQPIETNYLTESELNEALNFIIRTSQRESFPEYQMLIEKRSLPSKSPLLKFNVFLDENNVMRVGGRLGNSDFSYEKKHPILLQSTHKFTQLLFTHLHKKNLHAGPQLLLATIRETYWPIGGRNLAKSCYHRCVQCTRAKGKIVPPLMGNLPQQRLVPGGHPFQSVGVDYAGPMLSASRQGRGCRMVKVYIAIFICFTTKAIHLELVGDLTSNSFLLALYRFISRRGKPNNIYSDNGTSFVGAQNELSQFLRTNCNSFSETAANEGINFHFIPAYSPHFGGLWEAGVKSTKSHLSRVLGNCSLTFEEFYTLLVQIEAVLNSRPLTPLSSDPEDFTPLTPGHFLIGRPITALPVRDLEDRSTSHLTRFERIEQLRQHFWTRWSSEYVSELQQRTKWRSNTNPLKVDTLVLVKEDHLPPLKWKMGRVVAVYPGSDGISRVADIKTSTGVVRRSFSKICPLPIGASCDNSG